MKLLVVEDEAKLARSLRAALEHAGHAVDVASDGEMALDFARVYSLLTSHGYVVISVGLSR